MELNESPKPVFETDEQSTYFLTTIFAKPAPIEESTTKAKILAKFVSGEPLEIPNEKIDKMNQIIEKLDAKMILILSFLKDKGLQKKKKIFSHIELTTQSKNVKTYLIPLIEQGLIQPTFKDNRNSPLQTYSITPLGRSILQIKNSL